MNTRTIKYNEKPCDNMKNDEIQFWKFGFPIACPKTPLHIRTCKIPRDGTQNGHCLSTVAQNRISTQTGVARAPRCIPDPMEHMDIHGYSWISYPWISMHVHGYPWLSMDVHGYPWIYVDVIEYPCISMDTHGYQWISMDIHGYLRIHMDMHGYAWISIDYQLIVH